MSRAYPKEVLSLGDAIRKRRLDLGLLQKEVAAVIGCDVDTVINWEKGRRHPQIGQIGRVVEFLGYNPFPAEGSLAERLVNFRKTRGMRQKDFAHELGIDPSTLASYEQGHQPAEKCRKLLEQFLRVSAAVTASLLPGDGHTEHGLLAERANSRPHSSLGL